MVVHTENTVREEPVYFANVISVPVVSKGDSTSSCHQDRDCGKGRGVVFSWMLRLSGLVHSWSEGPNGTTTTSLGKSSLWDYSNIFRDCSFLPFFHNMERMYICWDWSQSAHLLIMYSNTASLHHYWFSKANYGSSATQKWIIVIPTDCW